MYLRRIALLIFAYSISLSAASYPSGFAEQVITGITAPTAMAFAPDGRLFVCQQHGELRVIKNGVLLTDPFLTVTTDINVERGLIGVVVPDNQSVYVYYTVPGPPTRNRVSRFTQAGDVAVPGSEVIITEFEPLTAFIHNSGALHFGPDGKLYVAVGENGVSSNAQSLNNRLGKIHRMNSDGTVPADNPFFNSPTVTGLNKTIWAYGLRNPFTFAFQPVTGRMFINDVGQDAFEEINDGVAGSNYGWPLSEGPTTMAGQKTPFYAYAHDQGCAITGGTFYNPAGNNFPSQYTGKYFFTDYCGGWIRVLDPSSAQVSEFATGAQSPVGLDVSPSGSLYYMSRGANSVYKVDYSSGQPVIQQNPQNVTVSSGDTAIFNVTATGAQPLSYQWQRNQVDIPTGNQPTLTLLGVTATDNGAQYRARVTNTFGTSFSNPATLTVNTDSNTPPKGTITLPAVGTLYSGGQTIAFAGSGTDTEDGPLPAANLCWVVEFHHDMHTHPFLPQTCGLASGSVTIPTTGETSSNVWYRFYLTVRDSGGRTTTTFAEVFPRKVNITLQSNPAGVPLSLDGQPITPPLQVTGVVGIVRNIGAVGQPSGVATRVGFVSWSDNGAATHDISTPTVDTTYTATFTPQYLLTLDTHLSSGLGSITAVPPTTDGYYSPGSIVQLTAIPSAGVQFGQWGGDASGTANPISVVMSAPRSVSALFGNLASCTYSLNQTTATVAASGDIRELKVITGTGCSWWATSQSPWLTISSGANGTGPGSVRFRVTSSSESSARVGTISVAGLSYNITQTAGNCRFDITGPTPNFPGSFGSYQLNISTGPGCQWTATAFPSAVTLGTTSGTGSGPLSFTLPQNETGPRAGYITVGGQFWQFTQASLLPVQPFTDVPLNYQFFDAVSLLKSNNVTPGCGGTNFCPDLPMTRSEMAAFIIRSLYGETFGYTTQPFFTDVGTSNPNFRYIQKLSEIGVTNGCTPTLYCPNDTVTRGQMAAFIVRAKLGITFSDPFPSLTTPLFDDEPATDIFFAYIQKLKELGITNGCTATKFCPADPNTRGQMAVFLIRALFTP